MTRKRKLVAGIGTAVLVTMALQLSVPSAVRSSVTALVSVVGNVAVTNPTDAGGKTQALLTADQEEKAYNAFRVTTNYCSFQSSECSVDSVNVSGNQVLVVNELSAFCSAGASDVPNEMVVTLINGQNAAVPAVQYWIPPLYIVQGVAGNPSGGGSVGKDPTGSVVFGKETYIVMDSTYNQLSSSITPTLNGKCSITYSGYYVRNN